MQSGRIYARSKCGHHRSRGATVESINLSQQPEMVERYGVMSTPVLVFERNGIEHSRINGVCNVDDVIGAIEKAREAR